MADNEAKVDQIMDHIRILFIKIQLCRLTPWWPRLRKSSLEEKVSSADSSGANLFHHILEVKLPISFTIYRKSSWRTFGSLTSSFGHSV